MGRRPRADRTPDEKWQIVQEGVKSGGVSETCRRHGISPSRFSSQPHSVSDVGLILLDLVPITQIRTLPANRSPSAKHLLLVQ
jgi:hypothetical protein